MNDAYTGAIIKLARSFQAWGRQHPGLIQIQFNYPEDVGVATPWTIAIREHLISTNEHGLAMLQAVCPTGQDEVTPTMIRIALKLIKSDAPPHN